MAEKATSTVEKKEDSFNVVEAEMRITEVLRFARVAGTDGADKFFAAIRNAMGPERADPLIAAAKEMAKVYYNTEDNPTNYHLNCIHSGTTKYGVVLETANDEVSGDDNDYDTEEQANAAIEKAVKEGRAVDGFVVDFDPDEWWAVLDKDNKNVFKMLFPTDRRALAFLYEKAKPAAYQAYLNSGHVIVGSEITPDVAKEMANNG